MKADPRYPGAFTDVSGISLGHAEDAEAGTGVTVALFDEPAACAVDVRGAAPGTRETDLLSPEKTVGGVNALCLAGGSAYGLAVCDGVMRFLESRGVGFETGVAKVPIVPGAVLFDLAAGSATVRPDAAMGIRAAESASRTDDSMGNVGAGCGATVGKILGAECAMKSGLGQASLRCGDLVVSAVVAVNALGDVVDPFRGNEPIAGLRDESKTEYSSTTDAMLQGAEGSFGKNTTIAIVASNAIMDKSGCLQAARTAHDGMARAIRPVHTMSDGDTIFFAATGKVKADLTLIGAMAADCLSKAIVNACITAETAYGYLAWADFRPN